MSLLDALRNYLVGEGLVRKPSVAGAHPPLWLEPKLGVPAAGEGNNPTEIGAELVLGAFRTGGIPSRPYESMYRIDVVDLRFRATNVPIIETTEAALRDALIDKRNWTMDDLTVIESLEWRPLQRLGSDEQGFEFVCAYRFQTYA